MLNTCGPSGSSAQCVPFVTGVVDTNDIFQEGGEAKRRVCLPKGVTVREMTDVFMRYLEAHPNRRKISGAVLVLASLAQAFSCP